MITLSALLMYLPGLGALGALVLSGALVDAVALAGGYELMRRLGVGPLVALGTAIAYLVSPIVVGMEGFSGTLPGYALLPAYAFVDLLGMRGVERSSGPALGLSSRAALP